ncbi:MAG: pyrroline-5-carboxylate reductase [Acidimicrobiales bacterium]
MPVKLLVVGGGMMGRALISGLLTQGWGTPEEIAVIEPDAERREHLAVHHEGLVTMAGVDDLEAGTVRPAEEGGGSLLVVKPDVAEGVCRQLGAKGVTRVASVVAGLSTARLEACLPRDAVVIRAVPNTPALIGAGVTVISGGANAHAADLDWAEGVLGAVGTVVRLPERHLDAVTGLSSSGPAYVFLVAESLMEAGVLVGLPRDLARTLVVETLLGSARLLAETGDAPETLRAAVTSPGGTTAAGLRALESRGVRSAFLEAVAAATERCRNLGR